MNNQLKFKSKPYSFLLGCKVHNLENKMFGENRTPTRQFVEHGDAHYSGGLGGDGK